MSTAKKKIVEELEKDIRKFEKEDPCRAFESSLLYLKAQNWLPKPETDCQKLLLEHIWHVRKCLAPSYNLKITELPESHYERDACKEAYRTQMEAAKCKVQETLEFDRNNVQTWKADRNADYMRRHFGLYSPDPFKRYFQKRFYLENPRYESEDMVNALKRSSELFWDCKRKSAY